MVENFKSIFTHLLYVPNPIYARLQIFIQLPQILAKLCHTKCDYLLYLVHIICSKCPSLAECTRSDVCKSRW